LLVIKGLVAEKPIPLPVASIANRIVCEVIYRSFIRAKAGEVIFLSMAISLAIRKEGYY
jgi:hypothetical protein